MTKLNLDHMRERMKLPPLVQLKILKRFFASQAVVAPLIFFFVIVILLIEAFRFFPIYNAHLEKHRRLGLEYFAFIDEALKLVEKNSSELNQIYQAEISWPSRRNDDWLQAYRATRTRAEDLLGDRLKILNDAIRMEETATDTNSTYSLELQSAIRQLQERIRSESANFESQLKKASSSGVFQFSRSPLKELQKLPLDEQEEIISAVAGLDLWTSTESEVYHETIKGKQELQLNYKRQLLPLDSLNNSIAHLENEFRSLRAESLRLCLSIQSRSEANVVISDLMRDEINAGLDSQSSSVKAMHFGKVLELILHAEFFDEFARLFFLETFSSLIKELDQVYYMEQLPESLRVQTENKLRSLEGNQREFLLLLRSNESALDSFPSAVPVDAMDAELRTLLYDLTRLERGTDDTLRQLSLTCDRFVIPFPFDSETQKLNQLTPSYLALVKSLSQLTSREFDDVDESVSFRSEPGQDGWMAFKKRHQKMEARLERIGTKLETWKFDRPSTWMQTLGSVFLGTEWDHGSNTYPRYGILPLLFASLVVSVFALLIAVPLSVAGALYTNEMAPPKQKSFIKVSMDLIGSVPTVILGFLGVFVLGNALRFFSESPAIRWFPGFPLETEFPLLLAGLLLALLACPVIFSLTMDTLNAVPQQTRHGALTLGASPLQTAWRVTIPASIKGILASILLGFSRVMGETIIVLMIAGNLLVTSNLERGMGILSSPSHSMASIVGSAMGTTPRHSMDHHALLMLAMILFAMVLLLNTQGRRLMAKYHQAPSCNET